jgi:diacylglycerol kinase (ATP)
VSRLRVGLLSNPSAAGGAAHRIGRQVGHLLQLSGISVVDLTAPTAPVARARALEVRDDLTALVVVGGDGTVSLGAEIVADSPVRLGVVPAVSGNDFARAAGLVQGDVEESVRQMLQALSRPVVAVDAIEIRSEGTGAPHRSIALGNVSLGFDAQVNARANELRMNPRLRYMTALAQELRSFAPLPYLVTIDDGDPVPLDASLVTVANSGILGGGMLLSPYSRLDDGILEVATLEGLGRAGLVRFLPRVFSGRHLSVPGFRLRSARRVKVELREPVRLRAYADGEPRSALPVVAEVLPGAVRLLADLPGAEPPSR